MTTTILKKTRPNPLRAWRHQQRKLLSMRRLAAQLGVSSVSVFDWETGNTTPRPENFAKIAALMGQDPGALRRSWDRWLEGMLI